MFENKLRVRRSRSTLEEKKKKMTNHRTSFTETEIYENETLKNDSILSDYERIQFIENGIGLSVTFIRVPGSYL